MQVRDFSNLPRNPPLTLGAHDDPLEKQADQAATSSAPVPARSATPKSAGTAPPVVHEALGSSGHPIPASSRAALEPVFGADFSSVRLHTGRLASRSAAAIGASAYTVGGHIVLGQDNAPADLLAHELAHVVQQTSSPTPWVQRQSAGAAPPPPRRDYVFIMGADPKKTNNPFYALAKRYFKAHLPAATMVEDQRSLDDLLGWLAVNVTAPIGDLYIVSHGNEDGTLAFGLDAGDKDGHMTVRELRDALHPASGGSGKLTSVASLVDAQTKIHIKGCDIGRTQEMVELLDEAFGGAGTVTAPTHEQDYSTDSTLGAAARTAAHDQRMGAFTRSLAPVPDAPKPVDRALKGDDRKAAVKAFNDATAARKKAQADRRTAIAAEERRIAPDLDRVAELATTVDSLSGPMCQRPGTRLFTAAEVRPEIDRLYGHLPEERRRAMAAALVAPDRGTPADQQGQRVERVSPFTETLAAPATLAEAQSVFAKEFKQAFFVPKTMKTTGSPNSAAGGELEMLFTGTFHKPGEDASTGTLTMKEDVPDDASVIEGGQAEVNNPARYQWRVERRHAASGFTSVKAIGERVKAYLHHGSLNASPHARFSKPESDRDFYAQSSFAPPPPPPPTPPAKP